MNSILGYITKILAQINLEWFEAASQQNTTFAILVSLVLILFGINIFLFKKYEEKNSELTKVQKENLTKVNEIRKEYTKREDERTSTWRESEKETLTVLKGVNSVLEMSEKMKENDTKNIIDKLSTLERSMERISVIETSLEKSIDNAIIELGKKKGNG